jgi:hypothetical protein
MSLRQQTGGSHWSGRHETVARLVSKRIRKHGDKMLRIHRINMIDNTTGQCVSSQTHSSSDDKNFQIKKLKIQEKLSIPELKLTIYQKIKNFIKNLWNKICSIGNK